MRLSSWIARGVATGLATHVALTVFENSPDAKVAFGTRSPRLGRLPQWRFFAPNPGVDNTHLLFRTRSSPTSGWGVWTEIPFRNSLRWYGLVWNPGSRVPKALFDAAQQLRTMVGLGSSYEWALRSVPYRLLSEVIADHCAANRLEGSFQFMLLTSRPEGEISTLQPILVSQEIPVAVEEAS